MEFSKVVQHAQKTPLFFPTKALGLNLWDAQERIIESVWRNRRTTVASCNAIGKTHTAAAVANSFLYTHFNSIVITTAPTYNQVVNVLWREIRGIHGRSVVPLGGEPLVDRLDLGANWYAKGFTTKDPENARGWHATGGHALVIVDEASGVAPPILDALEGAMTSPEVRILYIGNPTQSSGRFYDSHQSPLWHKIRIPAFETPNFIANGITTVEHLEAIKDHAFFDAMPLPFPMLVSPVWAWEKLQDWGKDSPLFRSLVCAEFPSQSIDAVFDLNVVMRAIALDYHGGNQVTRRSIGIDVARQGDDMTVICPLEQSHLGTQQRQGAMRQGNNILETVGMALEVAQNVEFNKSRDVFVVDDIGVGGGVTDILIHKGFYVLPFVSSAAGDEYNLNLRATATFDLDKALRNDEIALLDFGKQTKHLSAIRSKISHNGKRQIESKDDMKKRLGESPDFADALVMAWHGIKTSVGAKSFFTEPTPRDTIAANFLDAKF